MNFWSKLNFSKISILIIINNVFFLKIYFEIEHQFVWSIDFGIFKFIRITKSFWRKNMFKYSLKFMAYDVHGTYNYYYRKWCVFLKKCLLTNNFKIFLGYDKSENLQLL